MRGARRAGGPAIQTATPTPGTPPQIQVLPIEGPWRHAASGMQFPTAVGPFQRVSVIQYDRDGLNVSGGYNLVGPPLQVVATLYVYPPHGAGTREAACRQEFAGTEAEILRTYEAARLLEEHDEVLQQGAATHPGRQAVFSYRAPFGGETRALVSQLHLFCHAAGRWQVKYRISHPEGFDAAPLIADFMRRLVWTLGAETARLPLDRAPLDRAPLDRSAEPTG